MKDHPRYPKNRKCKICGKTLSVYNSRDICYHHYTEENAPSIQNHIQYHQVKHYQYITGRWFELIYY